MHAHDDHHDHAQDHDAHAGHAHADPATLTSRAFAISVALNGGFVAIEVAAGVLAGSVALVADAAHNLGDVLGLSFAWGAMRLARRKPCEKWTYGFRRSTILASLANAILLLVGVGAVTWEAIGRLRAPSALNTTPMILVAALGVLVNGGSALLFLRGRKGDANVRGAFLHLVADAAVSVGVVIASIVLRYTGWAWIDPVASIAVSAVILVGTWSLLREASSLALDGVPPGIATREVKDYLCALPNVREVHDLHIWALSTTETALTGHLKMGSGTCPSTFLLDVTHQLEDRFGIGHTTLQLEPPDAPVAECGCEPVESLSHSH